MPDQISEAERIAEAYIRMAKEAKYRPAAPGDGMGSVDLTPEEIADEKRLHVEAHRYTTRFIEQEDDGRFGIGCSNWATNRALVYVIEAARNLCGAQDDLALRLLEMAINEVKAERVTSASPYR